jgi:hypothetical protein
VIGKYIESAPDSDERAEDALRRALAINPRLSLAHKFYANLEADTGHADRAMVRLLGEANRHGNDPELFAGLVHACRYCGLMDESLAAHAEARRLDPNVQTGFEQTLLMVGDIERLIAAEAPAIIAGADDGIRVMGLGMAGHRDEARERLLAMKQRSQIPAFQQWTEQLMAWLDRRREDLHFEPGPLGELKISSDPEAIFVEGWIFCDIGDYEVGLDYVQRSVAKGYFASVTLSQSRQFDALRDRPAFKKMLADAEAGRQRALTAFREAGGERLLGS